VGNPVGVWLPGGGPLVVESSPCFTGVASISGRPPPSGTEGLLTAVLHDAPATA